MTLQPSGEDYERALARLRETSPIASKQIFGLVGQTPNGNAIFIPGSYEKGYFDSLMPPAQRPRYTTNLGIIGQLSDERWVFPPSYDRGLDQGTSDLKFAILAEAERRLISQMQDLEATQAKLMSELEQTRIKLEQMREELSHLKDKEQN